jgi:hypothetical protein
MCYSGDKVKGAAMGWAGLGISLTEHTSGTIHILLFGVNTTIELKNITTTSDDTDI